MTTTKTDKSKKTSTNVFRLATLFIDIAIHTLLLIGLIVTWLEELQSPTLDGPNEKIGILFMLITLYSYSSIFINLLADFFVYGKVSKVRKLLFWVYNILPLLLISFQQMVVPEYAIFSNVFTILGISMPAFALTVSVYQFKDLKYYSES